MRGPKVYSRAYTDCQSAFRPILIAPRCGMLIMPHLGALFYLEEGIWAMRAETHQVVSLSVTLQGSREPSGKSTVVGCILRHTCLCGVTSEYNWTSERVSNDRLGDLAYGLITEVSAVAGLAEHRLHSQDYSSD